MYMFFIFHTVYEKQSILLSTFDYFQQETCWLNVWGKKLKWWVCAFFHAFWQRPGPITAVFSVSGVVFDTDL